VGSGPSGATHISRRRDGVVGRLTAACIGCFVDGAHFKVRKFGANF
jgi:Fe-S-cluster-containing dehydrogenase component